jgi:hypothetical protein
VVKWGGLGLGLGHIFSYLWASGQVGGGLCYFSNSPDVVDFT